MVEQEVEAALRRGRYERTGEAAGHRHGPHRRQLTGSFEPAGLAVLRTRRQAEDGSTREWRSAVLPRYARRTRQLQALIASAYRAGTNTRQVQRALGALFRGAMGKDVVSRTWRKVKVAPGTWSKRDLAGEGIVRLVLDGTDLRVRLDRKASTVLLLLVFGIRRDGQKVQFAVRAMGGESEAVWRSVLDELVASGLQIPELFIMDVAAGLEKALAAFRLTVPAQRCTVHKHRNLLVHAPERLRAAKGPPA